MCCFPFSSIPTQCFTADTASIILLDAKCVECTFITDKNSTYATFLVFLTTAMAEAPNTDLWIGATSVYWHQFHWTDGRPMNYRNWGTRVSRHCVFCILIIHHVLHFYNVFSSMISPRPLFLFSVDCLFADHLRSPSYGNMLIPLCTKETMCQPQAKSTCDYVHA